MPLPGRLAWVELVASCRAGLRVLPCPTTRLNFPTARFQVRVDSQQPVDLTEAVMIGRWYRLACGRARGERRSTCAMHNWAPSPRVLAPWWHLVHDGSHAQAVTGPHAWGVGTPGPPTSLYYPLVPSSQRLLESQCWWRRWVTACVLECFLCHSGLKGWGLCGRLLCCSSNVFLPWAQLQWGCIPGWGVGGALVSQQAFWARQGVPQGDAFWSCAPSLRDQRQFVTKGPCVRDLGLT